jgi:hypothetical protein
MARRALDAVGAEVLGTVFTMVPASGPRAYGQYNAYYRADAPELRAVPVVDRSGSRGTGGHRVGTPPRAVAPPLPGPSRAAK